MKHLGRDRYGGVVATCHGMPFARRDMIKGVIDRLQRQGMIKPWQARYVVFDDNLPQRSDYIHVDIYYDLEQEVRSGGKVG